MIEPTESVPTTETTAVWPRLLAAVLLILILAVGGYFRLVGLNWDSFTHLHPDERFLTLVTAKLETVRDPWLYLRSSESPLNPFNKGEGFYVYGNFPMTVTKYVSEWAEQVRALCTSNEPLLCQNDLTGYNGVHLIGRILSAFTDLLSILLTFAIGRRLYGRRVGLLAAFLLATAVMPIQQSHFYTMDNWAAALTTLTLYTAVRASEAGHRKRWWVAFGLGLGLVVASRINVAPLALMAGVAALVWLVRRQQAHADEPFWPYLFKTTPGSRDLQYAIAGVLIAAITSLITFRLAQPYAFTDAPTVTQSYLQETGREPSAFRLFWQSTIGFDERWSSSMSTIQNLQSPEATFPPALQWVDRTAILFPLSNMILYGLGLLAGLAAWVGLGWALWRVVKARPDWLVHALPVSWTLLYFLFSATRWVKSIRYFLPIYPTLLLLAAWALFFVWQRANGRPLRRALAGVLITLTAVSNLLWANAFVEIYRQPLTRVAASEWLFENVPSAVTLLYHTAEGIEKTAQLPVRDLGLQPNAPAYILPVTLPEAGTITAVRLNYLTSDTPATATVLTTLNGVDGEAAGVAFNGGERLAVTIDLPDTPLGDQQVQQLTLQLSPTSNPIRAETSVITSEHWDDALPARFGGRDAFGQYFRGLEAGSMPTTHPDSGQKRLDLYGWLEEADYIVLSSQRSSWSLPRLPLTYPLMMAYYEGLFDGSLGFDQVAEFHGDIHIGPLYISDTGGALGWGQLPDIGWPPPPEWAAEEAFSVYDHPPVWVFKKRADFDIAQVVAQLGAVDLTQTMFMNPQEATNAPNAMQLSATQTAVQQQNGTFRQLFNLDGVLSNNGFVAALVWWLVVVALGWLAFPLSYVVFRGLADRGFALSRILALLWLSYFPWLTASGQWLDYSRQTIVIALLILAAASLLILVQRGHALRDFVQRHWRVLLVMEAVGLALYLLQLLIRLGNPDAWHVIWGGEKPMDMAYFTAVLKSSTFPPYDPWFAGGYLNYYYYGFVYVGSLTKLLGIVPGVAYNLILPMLYSFTGLGAFSLAYNLVAWDRDSDREFAPQLAVYAGLFATTLSVFLGNLAQLRVIFTAWERATALPIEANRLFRILDGGWRILSGSVPSPLYTGDWFWTATRAIGINEGEVAPITEFPFFTFLYGDLHAHMIALPLTLLALGWAISAALHTREATRGQTLLFWGVGALAIGVLYPTNSWDYPTYLVIGCLALLFHGWRTQGVTLPMLGQWLVKAAVLFATSLLAFWPFWRDFGSGYNSLKLWPGSYTGLGDYFAIYGLFLLIAVVFLAAEFKRWAQSWTTERLAQQTHWIAAAVIALYGVVAGVWWLVGQGYTIAPLVVPLILLAGVLGVWSNASPARKVAHILLAAGFGLTLFVELFVLEGDIGRMNTVFKFYMQVWLLFSVAAGAAIVWLGTRMATEWGAMGRGLWRVALAALILVALLYPVLATRAKWQIRMAGNHPEAQITLDGLDFMRYVSYGERGQEVFLDGDYAAIQWMHHNIDGSPVVAEAHSGNPYRSVGSRIAMYTGLPTIIGWDWHQRQQRLTTQGWQIGQRIGDVNALYNTEDSALALDLLEKYEVRYLYVGQLERVYYAPQGIAKFAQMAAEGALVAVYEQGGTTIYEVVGR